MAQDHYIAQTYLKHFGDPSKNGMLNVYRKSDGKQFPCWPQAVCREWDGDLNPEWLSNDPALLGQFRKIFEPKWNPAIDSLLSSTLTAETRLAISGYAAQLLTCTPTWRRIGVKLYDDGALATLSFEKKMQEKHGYDPNFPVEAVEMLEKGELKLEHDPDAIKAIVTQQLMDQAWVIYNQDWIILKNNTECPFITSDNPMAILPPPDYRFPAIRFLPITPTLCISIRPVRRALPSFDLSLPPGGKLLHRKSPIREVKFINRQQARCAEDLIFAPIETLGIAALVKNAARFRMEGEYREFSSEEPDTVYHGSLIQVRQAK